ncbi:IS21 family transposase, partial [Acetobacterium wieringae]
MLNLMDKHAVIRLKKEGHSNRSLEKMLGINRKTIGKYWNDYLKDMSQLETGDCDLREIQEKIAAPPKYDVSKRQYRKYTEAMDEFLDDILASEKKKDAILGTHKQK